MSKTDILFRFLFLLPCLCARWAFAEETATPHQRPNLIVILADDLGAKELACYGHPEHRTPNLDALAAQGVQFDTAFATPICHPTRLMIMTGQYGHHNKVYNFANRRGGPDPDSPEEQIVNHYTFGQHLKAQGYVTALAGKWQLSGEVPDLVHEAGFDEYRIWAYANNLPKGVEHTGGWEKGGEKKPERYWHPCILENGKYLPTKPEEYGPDLHTDFLIDFIKRKKDGPFFVYYPICLTHAPHYQTPDTIDGRDKESGNDKERFKAAVEYMDKLVGRIVATLDDLGLRENTLIIFTADNGTGGDGKADPTELGARVPLIINAPGMIKQRGKTEELSDLTDIFPTLADFAGAPIPEGRVIDGKSLHDFLVGKTDAHREWIYSYLGDHRVLRTKRYLLENNSPFRFGTMYDCGDSRNGNGYRDITASEEPEAATAKAYFSGLIEKLPVPALEEDGLPKDPKKERGKDRKRGDK